MQIKYINPTAVKDILDGMGGSFFGVTFVKRGDNTVRTMNCRRKVKKGIKGTGKRTKKTGLYTVYDMIEEGYRTINMSGIHRIRTNGVEYRVTVN